MGELASDSSNILGLLNETYTVRMASVFESCLFSVLRIRSASILGGGGGETLDVTCCYTVFFSVQTLSQRIIISPDNVPGVSFSVDTSDCPSYADAQLQHTHTHTLIFVLWMLIASFVHLERVWS